MRACLVVLALVLSAAISDPVGAATIEVSQPTQLTSDVYYERGQSLTYGGSEYWLIYGRSTTVTGNYQNDTPDTHDYDLYFKKAASIPGLAGAAANQITSSADSYLGETDAAYFGGKVWAFATLDVGGSATLYGWHTVDGTTWTQVTIKTGLPVGAAHHAATSFGGELWVAYNTGADWNTLHSASPETVDWSTLTAENVGDPATNGTAKFYDEGGTLYLALGQSSVISIAAFSGGAWSIADQTAVLRTYDPAFRRIGGTYLFVKAPLPSDWSYQWLDAKSGATLNTLLSSGTDVTINNSAYGSNTWTTMWPTLFNDAQDDTYLFFTSERNPDNPASEITGNIWCLKVDWDLSRDHYTYVQNSINGAGAGDVINVAAATYGERLTVNKSLDLRGSQYGVDPTPGGARTDSAEESTLDIAGLAVTNPNVAVEVPGGVTGVSIGGFTLIGSPTLHYADEAIIRSWDDNLTIQDNIMDGYICWLGKGGDHLTFESNKVTGNKGGVIVQPSPGTDVTIIDNLFMLGSSPAGDESAIYMTSVTGATVSGNTATGFVNAKGIAGSSVSQINVTGNTFTGNKDAVSFWGSTTFVTIAENDLSNSLRYGISIKGQDITIENNAITGCGDTGVNVDRHVIDTERVSIASNDLSGNTNYGVQVNTALVTETIDASGNWWGSNVGATVQAFANNGSGVDYTPWLGTGTDMDDPGFQGDFSSLYVDDDSPQSGATGRIQEGIDLVSGSTVNVAAGTYAESIVFPADFAVDGLVLSGDAVSRPVITGGMRFLQTATLNGMTIENLHIQGVPAGGNLIVSMDNAGAVNDFVMDNCVIDGENVSGRPGFGGQRLSQSFTMTNCEFKDILGWAVMDIESGSGDGGTQLAFTTVTFADNSVHDCNGSVALRGNAATRSTVVNAYGNTFTNIGGNQAEQGEQWAALEINHAETANVYNNLVDDVALGIWGEGQAFQFWDIGTLNMTYNVLTNNAQGIFFFSGGGVYGGPYAIPSGSISYNSITGNAEYGIAIQTGATGGPLDAEMNWWGDASGPGGDGPGIGDAVSGDIDYTPWIGMTGGENIVCVPDPQVFSGATPTNAVTVRYLGGGGGLVYGYSLSVSWDDTKASLNSITQDDLLSSQGSTVFQVTGTGNTRTVDCALLGDQPGVTGPGDMFTLSFTGTGCGESTVDVTVIKVRDKNNADLAGFYEDDGLLQIDLISPTVSSVQITNSTLAHTNDYAKDGDTLVITAEVSDGCDYGTLEASDIEADLSDLLSGGGGAVTPDSYAAGVATWTLSGVTLTADGTKTVTVTATDELGNTSNGSDTIIVDNTAPAAVSGFDAAPEHNEIDLSWDDASGSDTYYAGVMVRRVPWGDYPQYATEPDYPADETVGAEAFSGTGTAATDSFTGSTRDIYYYQAFAYDEARNYGPAAGGARDRATSYWLGDVRPGTPSFDGSVTTADIDALGTSYGKSDGEGGFESDCDVGPTDTGSRVGIPTPDDIIDFEDLMIFAMNFGVVAPLQGPTMTGKPDAKVAAVVDLRLVAPLAIAPGGEFVATVVLDDASALVQGIRFAIAFDGRALELREVSRGSLVEGQSGPVFFATLDRQDGLRTLADVSVAILGQQETFGGSGEVARFRFRVRSASVAGLELTGVRLRDTANHELTATTDDSIAAVDPIQETRNVPSRLTFSAGHPNPLRTETVIVFGLPAESKVALRLYSVTGKVVSTLVEGLLPAGEHRLVWQRCDDTGRQVPAGIYFARLQSDGKSLTRKLIVLE